MLTSHPVFRPKLNLPILIFPRAATATSVDINIQYSAINLCRPGFSLVSEETSISAAASCER